MSIEDQLLSALEKGEFDESKNILEKNKISNLKNLLNSISFFSKKKKRPVIKKFWKSDLSVYIYSNIVKDFQELNFLNSYFQSKCPWNFKFSMFLWKENESLFKSLFKKLKRYKFESWMTELSNISKALPNHKRLSINLFIDELEYLVKLDVEIIAEIEKDYEKLLKIPMDKIFIGICYVYEELMQSTIIQDNLSWQTKFTMAIVTEFKEILNYLRKHKDVTQKVEFESNLLLQNFWESYRPNHKLESPQDRVPQIDDDLKKIQSIIKNGVLRQKKKFAREAYLAGYGKFNSMDGILEIEYNSEFEKFNFNNSKNPIEESYFVLKNCFGGDGFSSIKPIDHCKLTTHSWLSILAFYKIPLLISDSKIKIEIVLKVLCWFSRYKSPLGFDYLFTKEDGKLVNKKKINEPDQKFVSLFGGNESISVFNYNVLILNIAKYFNCDPNDIVEALDFLVLDLSKNDYDIDYLYRPFIKIESNVYWLGRLLKDRRWDTILRNKLKEDKLVPKREALKNLIDKNLEEAVGKLFSDEGFSTKVGLVFPNPDRPELQGGDIDVIAFKDNYLFVIQIKNSVYRDEISNAVYIENRRFEDEAVEQIDKSLFYVKQNWSEINIKLKFQADMSMVEIVPLIVCNVFEGDLKIYKGYRKTSLFELARIMKNDLKSLSLGIDMMQFANRLNPDFRSLNEKMTMDFDLWNGMKKIDGRILLGCIENNSVWKKLESTRDFTKA